MSPEHAAAFSLAMLEANLIVEGALDDFDRALTLVYGSGLVPSADPEWPVQWSAWQDLASERFFVFWDNAVVTVAMEAATFQALGWDTAKLVRVNTLVSEHLNGCLQEFAETV